MNRKYEVLLLLKPSLAKEDLIKLLEKIEAKMGGKIIKKEEWGVKKLAYKIKKCKEAIYVLYYLEAESENIIAMKNMIAIDKNVLRPMIIKHDKKWPFEYKTSKELKFPVRKPKRNFNNPKFNKQTSNIKAKEVKETNVAKEEDKKNDK